MRACIVLEIMMLCIGFCLTSVLVQSVCDAWWGGRAEGGHCSVACRCRFLAWNSWTTARHILYSHVLFVLSVASVYLSCRLTRIN